jgi:hypothetical protein
MPKPRYRIWMVMALVAAAGLAMGAYREWTETTPDDWGFPCIPIEALLSSEPPPDLSVWPDPYDPDRPPEPQPDPPVPSEYDRTVRGWLEGARARRIAADRSR